MKISKNLKEANNLIQLKLTKMEKEKNAIQQKYEKEKDEKDSEIKNLK